DQVTIIVDALPTTSAAGTDQTICSSSATLAGNTAVVGNGLWTLISGTGTITTPSSPTSGVNGLSVGANVFEWTITNGTCPSSSDQVTITRDAIPSPANAGIDTILCTNTVSLNGNVPTTGTGTWTLSSGSGTIVSPFSPTTTVLALGTGVNEFQWTISNGVCPSLHDTVIAEVDGIPTTANAGADQVICSSSATLSGNTIVTGSGTWSLISGNGVITNTALPNSTISGMTPGMHSFEWRAINGTCPASVDTVVITVDQNPTTAAAGADTTLCSSTDTLSANTALVGTGNWTLVSGSGVIDNPFSPITAITGLGTGTNIFSWTISNGTCPSSSDQVAIVQDVEPSVSVAGADHNRCFDQDTLNGNVPLSGAGLWTVISGGANLVSPLLPVCAVNDLTAGVNIFEWKISNGTCPSSADTVHIVYNEAPSPAAAGSDILACENNVTLQAQTPLVGGGVWDPIGGSPPLADSLNPNASISLAPGTWFYAWTVTNGFCVSPTDTLSITVYSLPSTALAGNDQLIHTSFVTLNAEPADTGTGTWTFVQGSGSIENIHDPFTRVTNLSPGVNILRWTTSNGVCPESSDDVHIESLPLIVPEGYSPNGDGVNDNFEISGLLEYNAVSLEVFNRWGNVVFVSADYRNNWNGTGRNGETLPDDIYYYILRADEGIVFTGFVAIKRSVQ
ncbi:MAG TPA: gliding motility-associated C-terminal domain-containing protein, partial [Bacteroidia bacterium]|nr:gliding motility-associated C-terminal domain-containing protein [Bacteroidia bacterium]